MADLVGKSILHFKILEQVGQVPVHSAVGSHWRCDV